MHHGSENLDPDEKMGTLMQTGGCTYLFAGSCMSIVQQTQPYRRLPDGHTEHQAFAQAYSLSPDARQDDWDLIRLLQTTPGSDSRWLGWQVIVGIEAHALLR